MGFSFSFAQAATLFLAPSSGAYNVGSTFSILVRVNTSGASINAAEGVLTFNPNELSVVSLSKSGTIFNLWVQEPEFSNALGTVNFGGIIFNPGFTGASGTILTINLKAKAVSAAQVTFSSGAALANDGLGTNVLSALNGGTYTLRPTKAVPRISPPPTVVPPATEVLPVILSTTHPDPEKWYSRANPEFSWTLPSGTDNVSYLVHSKPNASPGTIPDGLKDSVSFTDIDEGITYFHLRFHGTAGWGPVAHYKLKIDTESPENFEIERIDEDDFTDPQPKLFFGTADKTSGINRYEMKIGDGDWFRIDKNDANRTYKIPLQMPGTYNVIVKAFDQAGNSTSADILVVVESIPPPVIEEISAEVKKGEPIIIKGKAEPGYNVIIYILNNKGLISLNESYSTTAKILGITANAASRIVKTIEVTADRNGRWEVEVRDLKPGKYSIHARTQDSRGAISKESNGAKTQVGQNIFERIFDGILKLFSYLINGIRKNMLFVGFIVVSVGLLIALIKLFEENIKKLWQKIKRFKKKIKIKFLMKDEEKELLSKLKHLQKDIEEELKLLEKIKHQRGLSAEEAYLRDKLKSHLEFIRGFGNIYLTTEEKNLKEKLEQRLEEIKKFKNLYPRKKP